MEPFSVRRLLLDPPDVVHVNWPEAGLRAEDWRRAARRSLKSLLRCVAVRARGVTLFWTVHNLASHEREHPRLERFFWACFSRLVSRVITLTSASVDELYERLPALQGKVAAVVPHGHYLSELVAPHDRRPTYDIGMVGSIRTYKAHYALLAALAQIPDQGLRVLIAGAAPDAELVTGLREQFPDGRVEWRLGQMSDEDFQRSVEACRLLVIAQTSELNSGSLIFALSCRRPVLAIDTPTFREIRQAVGSHWLRLVEPPLSAADLMRALEDLPDAGARGPDLSSFGWARIGEAARRAYELSGADG